MSLQVLSVLWLSCVRLRACSDLELKSVRKKYKSKGFAAGCSREVIERGADMLGWSLDELIERTIEALRTFRD